MDIVLNQTSRIYTITIALISLQLLLLASIFISSVYGLGLFDNNNNNKSITRTIKSTSETEYFSHNDNHTLNTGGSFANQSTMPMAKINSREIVITIAIKMPMTEMRRRKLQKKL